MVFIPNPLKSRAANVKAGVLKRPTSGQMLRQVLGDQAAKNVIDIVVDHHLAPSVAANHSYDQLFNAADIIIGLELQHVGSARFRLGGLSVRLGLHNMAGPLALPVNHMPIQSYGGVAGDAQALLAAKWLVNASNTLSVANIPAIRDTLLWINQQGYPLNTVAGLQQINYLVNIGGGVPPAYRAVATGGGQIVCSASGARLLELALQQTAMVIPGAGGITWTDYALYLLAVVVRAHGFTDGNGRAARAAFAVAMLRGGVPFLAPNNAFEQSLHGL